MSFSAPNFRVFTVGLYSTFPIIMASFHILNCSLQCLYSKSQIVVNIFIDLIQVCSFLLQGGQDMGWNISSHIPYKFVNFYLRSLASFSCFSLSSATDFSRSFFASICHPHRHPPLCQEQVYLILPFFGWQHQAHIKAWS